MPANSYEPLQQNSSAMHEPTRGTTNDFEPLLDTEEAAHLLRMHPRTLRTKAREGLIPGIQVGKRWRFRVSALNNWLLQIVK
jgi:excisionase family DNA binding protein